VEATVPSAVPAAGDSAAARAEPAWRHRLFNALLAVFAVVSLPVLVNEALYRDDWLTAAAAWGVLPVLMVLRRRLDFTLRAGVLVTMLLLLGLWATSTAGLMSSGRIFMGASAIVGALLLGRRAGILLFALGTVATAALLTVTYVSVFEPAQSVRSKRSR